MKKATLLFILFLILPFSGRYLQAQQVAVLSNAIGGAKKKVNVWVYFTDKGGNLAEKLKKAENNLPKNAIKRRRKLKPTGNIAVFNDLPVESNYIQKISKIATIRYASKWLNAVSAEVNLEDIEQLRSYSFVKRITGVRKIKAATARGVKSINLQNKSLFSANTTLYNLNYGSSLKQLEQIGVPEIHDLGFTGNDVIICVLDAGFNNLEHEVFASLDTIASYDFVNNDPNVDDQNIDMGTGNHGTMTLSTLGGFAQGELIGTAYGAKFILAKTENTDSETLAEEDAWVAAMEWAESNYGPDISSTSLGYVGFDNGYIYDTQELNGEVSAISIASEAAAAIGIVVVQSAGNSGQGSPTTIGAPADADSTLTIGAVDSLGTISTFSSIGPTGDGRIKPDLMAMGTAVYVADVTGNTYRRANGTSFSCPIAAGTVALLSEMAPTANNVQLIEALKMSASNANTPDNYYGWGLINLPAAYHWLINPHIYHSPHENVTETALPFIIEAEVKSSYAPILSNPKLFYRVNLGAWQQVEMASTFDQFYMAEIPAPNENSEIEYYFQTENENSEVKLPSDAPNTVYYFTAGLPISGISHLKYNDISIFPNPTSKFVTFKFRHPKAEILIYSSTGQLVLERHTSSIYTISVKSWKSGVYYAKVKTGGEVFTQKFAVIH